MKLRIASARQGVSWVQDGIKTFWKQPLALTSLFFLSMMVLSIIGAIPIAGAFVALALLPVSTLCMLIGSALAQQGTRPSLPTVIKALPLDPERRNAFVMLGLFYALSFLLVLGFSALFDGGQFAKLNLMGGNISREIVEQPDFQRAMFATLLLYAPLSMLFWHAPALIYWHRVPAAKAVFFSMIACVRNMGAFLLYTIAWAAVGIGFGIVLALLSALLGAALGSWGAAVLAISGSMMLAAMFLTSVVFSFRDCFEAPDLPDTASNSAEQPLL